MEPNVVFSYKIETEHYLTFSELREYGEWQTYELNHEDDFFSFNHERHKPLVGRGYLVKLDNNTMVKIINEQIQKHRMAAEKSPVHIVISESAAGTLRVGLDRPKVVLGFPDSFSIGPIWKLDEKVGQTNRFDWIVENINTEQEDYEFENKFANMLLELEDIPEQVPIYLWTANNASEQTGVRFILQLLKDKVNEVILLNSTELFYKYISTDNVEQSIYTTSQIDPKSIKYLFDQAKTTKPLSNEDKLQLRREWETLSQTQEVLRIWVENQINSVPEHHYDQLIINTLEMMHNQQESKDFIKAARVIGEIFGHMDEMISDSFLEFRIRHLVYHGVFELKGIPKSMRHYSVKLRK